jgi:phage repressor protein C with HTH and peptisase S24 domain
MSAIATHRARYSLLSIELPGVEPFSAGVLLEDPSADRLYVRLRRDWNQVAPEEADVLSLLEDDLNSKASELGASKLLASLEDTLSNTMRVTEAREVMVEDFDRALARLYRQHVRSAVQEFVTHLPRYSLAAAAGAFLENQTISAEGWEEAPTGLRLAPELFVARVVGHSMEPLIPDGSLCVFKTGVTGSRAGRLVLVEEMGGGRDDRYTVKRYTSEKTQAGETWAHEKIILEPLNPDFPTLKLEPEEERYRIVAEFVQVLD